MNRSLIFMIMLMTGLCPAKILKGTRISGRIPYMSRGYIKLILEEDINRKIRITIAEIPVDATGHFTFEKDLTPNIYSLEVNDRRSIMLAVDEGQNIIVNGDNIDTTKFEVSGSSDTEQLIAYEAFRKESLDRLVNSVRTQILEMKNKGIAENAPELLRLNDLEVQNYSRHKNELISFIAKNMGTSLGVYATSIRWSGDTNLVFLRQLATRFETAHPKTTIAAKLREKVAVLIANEPGSKSRPIAMPDESGKKVALSSIRAKYILVDFWASWCAPCRRESPELIDLYRKFKPLGFEIYAVDLDSKKEPWLKAIAADKRTWINVSTFEGFETAACFDYAVTALPSNVLIDGNGKIIARNLHGAELKIIMDKLFYGAGVKSFDGIEVH